MVQTQKPVNQSNIFALNQTFWLLGFRYNSSCTCADEKKLIKNPFHWTFLCKRGPWLAAEIDSAEEYKYFENIHTYQRCEVLVPGYSEINHFLEGSWLFASKKVLWPCFLIEKRGTKNKFNFRTHSYLKRAHFYIRRS